MVTLGRPLLLFMHVSECMKLWRSYMLCIRDASSYHIFLPVHCLHFNDGDVPCKLKLLLATNRGRSDKKKKKSQDIPSTTIHQVSLFMPRFNITDLKIIVLWMTVCKRNVNFLELCFGLFFLKGKIYIYIYKYIYTFSFLVWSWLKWVIFHWKFCCRIIKVGWYVGKNHICM